MLTSAYIAYISIIYTTIYVQNAYGHKLLIADINKIMYAYIGKLHPEILYIRIIYHFVGFSGHFEKWPAYIYRELVKIKKMMGRA